MGQADAGEPGRGPGQERGRAGGGELYGPCPGPVSYTHLYGNDVDEIIRKQKELEAAARETTRTVTEGTEQQERSVVGLKDSMRLALEVFQRFPSTIKGAFEAAGDAASGATMKTRSLQDEIDRYTCLLYTSA